MVSACWLAFFLVVIGYESWGFLLMLSVVLLKTSNSSDHRNLVGLVVLFSVYAVVRFVMARDYREMTVRVKAVDTLAVTYAGSQKSLNEEQAKALREYDKNVRTYLDFRKRVIDAEGDIVWMFFGAVPRLRMMWNLESLRSKMELSAYTCRFANVSLPGYPGIDLSRDAAPKPSAEAAASG